MTPRRHFLVPIPPPPAACACDRQSLATATSTSHDNHHKTRPRGSRFGVLDRGEGGCRLRLASRGGGCFSGRQSSFAAPLGRARARARASTVYRRPSTAAHRIGISFLDQTPPPRHWSSSPPTRRIRCAPSPAASDLASPPRHRLVTRARRLHIAAHNKRFACPVFLTISAGSPASTAHHNTAPIDASSAVAAHPNRQPAKHTHTPIRPPRWVAA
jgi:hypothetical protein